MQVYDHHAEYEPAIKLFRQARVPVRAHRTVAHVALALIVATAITAAIITIRAWV